MEDNLTEIMSEYSGSSRGSRAPRTTTKETPKSVGECKELLNRLVSFSKLKQPRGQGVDSSKAIKKATGGERSIR